MAPEWSDGDQKNYDHVWDAKNSIDYVLGSYRKRVRRRDVPHDSIILEKLVEARDILKRLLYLTSRGTIECLQEKDSSGTK